MHDYREPVLQRRQRQCPGLCPGNGGIRYRSRHPRVDDPETVLLIDSWRDQAAIDSYHASPMMGRLAALREKYDLHMTAERFVSDELGTDEAFIRK